MKHQYDEEELKIIKEFGSHVTPISCDYIRKEEEYDPQANFFG